MIAFILLTLTTNALAQISGEFWWLNDKLAQLKGIEAPAPVFEEVSEFDTDESDKIIFRDDTHIKPEANAINENPTKSDKWKIEIQFKNEDKIIWPSDTKKEEASTESSDISKVKGNNGDDFNFIYPSDFNAVNKIKPSELPMKVKNNKKEILYNNKDNVKLNLITNTEPNTENICTYMKKSECYLRDGIIYKKINKDDSRVCCILPLVKDYSSSIIFPDTFLNGINRHKRSVDKNPNPIFKQKSNFFTKRIVIPANAQREINPRVVTSDEDYIDPYWNIKNSKIKNSNPNRPTKTKNDCYQDYVEDYIIEVPKPGLVGLYSDGGPTYNDNTGPSYGGNVPDYDYNDDPPGYSTVDPRRSTVKPPKGGPSFLTGSDEVPSPESQTISYQSNPDFHVLQGFKLLNLSRNKNRFYSKNTRNTLNAESVIEENNEETVLIKPAEKVNKDFKDKQVFKNCGNTVTNPNSNGKQIGNTENGSHPWLALVVQTKRRQSILCYATIIHPRAAVTSADCVQGSSKGDITLVAGLWDLKDRSRSQNRVVSVFLHPQYTSNELVHNVAVLCWTQPLRLGANVQPACIGEPINNIDGDCKLYGWSGFDQAIRPRSRWQTVTLLTPGQCSTRLNANKRDLKTSTDAFCASVGSRGTVSGIGGSLICNVQGRSTATGVAVSRDNILVFAPILNWPRKAVLDLLAR